MEYKTKISKVTDDDVIVRGQKLSDLIIKGRFTDTIFLQLSGREPNEKESKLFEMMLISIIDHGMGTTSSMSARYIASGGNSLNVGVGGGILSIGDYHGGAIEKAMVQFYNLSKLSNEKITDIVIEKISNKETIFGFGHKHYKNGDPRVKVLVEEMSKTGFESKHLFIKDLIENSFKEVKGNKIYCNIDGLLAILLCDFGFDRLLGKGIFIIGRTPGLVAQTFEEIKDEKPVRRISEDSIEYVDNR
jgi:citryl-CoA lyase